MYSKTGDIRAWSGLVAAVTAVALVAGNAVAHDRTSVESIQISTQGLDLNRAADAQVFYTRLQNAAWVVCTRGLHVALVPVDDQKACVETALGDAIRSAKVPMLTQIYLGTHTLQQAAAHGIKLPDQVAAK